MLTSESEETTRRPATIQRTALIVAPEQRGARIAELLEGDDVDVAIVASVEGLDETGLRPTVVLVWVEGFGSSIAGSLQPIARRLEGVPLIAVCEGVDRWGVRAALSAGASGLVTLDDLDTVLLPCVLAVEAGQACVPQAHGRQIEPPALSAREKQILSLVVMGYMNGQIAEQLFLAESTVKSHLSSAFGKLGVRSRNEAVHLILDPDRGLGMGILGLGGEPIELASKATS